MKVYTVYYDDYDSWTDGVFSTPEKAREFVAKKSSPDQWAILEWELDVSNSSDSVFVPRYG